MGEVWLGNIRLVTCSSLLGYGAADPGLVPYGMSPVARFVPLERFGAVTTRCPPMGLADPVAAASNRRL